MSQAYITWNDGENRGNKDLLRSEGQRYFVFVASKLTNLFPDDTSADDLPGWGLPSAAPVVSILTDHRLHVTCSTRIKRKMFPTARPNHQPISSVYTIHTAVRTAGDSYRPCLLSFVYKFIVDRIQIPDSKYLLITTHVFSTSETLLYSLAAVFYIHNFHQNSKEVSLLLYEM